MNLQLKTNKDNRTVIRILRIMRHRCPSAMINYAWVTGKLSVDYAKADEPMILWLAKKL